MFNANSSISSTRLKSLSVVKGRENMIGWGGTGSDWGSDWGDWMGYGGVDDGMGRS